MAQQSMPAPVSTYQYSGQSAADTGAQQGIQGLSQMPNYAQQLYGQYAPALGSMSQQTSYNPQQTVDAGNNIQSSVSGLPGYANQTLQTGYDPQSSLYNRTQQQLQDQTRAGLEARGLDMTPYGAGVEGQTMSNFDIDWQNTQLGRQQTAAGTANSLLGQYAGSTGAGASLSAGVPQQQLAAAQGLSSLGTGSYQLPQQVISDYMQYLQGGTSADNSAVSNYSAQANAANAYNKQLGDSLGGLGKLGGWAWGSTSPNLGGTLMGALAL